MQISERSVMERRLGELLASHATVKLATASPDGTPWIATAYFVEEGPFALLFMLEGGGRTVTNMRKTGRVALMLENGNAMELFAQGEGVCEMVEGAEARFRDAIAEKTPASAPLVGLPGLLAVRVVLERWKLTDVPGGWLPARTLAAAA